MPDEGDQEEEAAPSGRTVTIRESEGGFAALGTAGDASLQEIEPLAGRHPGDRYLRLRRQHHFRRRDTGYIVARDFPDEAQSPLGRALSVVRRTLIGRPLPSAAEVHERLNVFTGLAVFASDNISSSA